MVELDLCIRQIGRIDFEIWEKTQRYRSVLAKLEPGDIKRFELQFPALGYRRKELLVRSASFDESSSAGLMVADVESAPRVWATVQDWLTAKLAHWTGGYGALQEWWGTPTGSHFAYWIYQKNFGSISTNKSSVRTCGHTWSDVAITYEVIDGWKRQAKSFCSILDQRTKLIGHGETALIRASSISTRRVIDHRRRLH